MQEPVTAVNVELQRSDSISRIRLIALLLIVSCHIMQWLNLELAFWFNVGVQIFLCISGFLYGQKNTGEVTAFYSRRFKKILIPYFVVFISYGIIQFIFAKETFEVALFLKGIVINDTVKGAEHLWFVSTILFCYVLTPLLEAYRDRFVTSTTRWFLYLLFSVEITYVFFGLFDKFFNPAWISCYVIGYLLGINEKEKYISAKLLCTIALITAIAGNSIQIYCSYIAQRKFVGYQYFYNFNHVVLGVAIFLTLKLVFDSFVSSKDSWLINSADKYSYEVYLVHQLIILGPFSLMSLTPLLGLNICIIIIAVCLMAFTLSKVVNLIKRSIE